jgi:hypothetical protein
MIRNPANGLREWQPYAAKLDKNKIKYVGSKGTTLRDFKGRFPHWYFAWQEFYSCYFVQFYLYPGHLRRFWIGWKIQPQDTLGKYENDYRQRGAAFTIQFKKIEVR